MAHEIDQTTGKAAVFVTGEPAWHKLGVVVSEAQTSAEAIKLAGLDWTVQQKPIFRDTGKIWEVIASHVANVRSDTGAVLGVVGDGYRPFQNVEAFDFMDSIVSEKLAMFETAGALKGGKQVWMLARIPKDLRIAKNDVVNPYVLLTNAHDGTKALRMIPTTVRVVCNNTLTLALNRAGATEGLKIVHTESLSRRVEEARQKLGVITRTMDAFAIQATRLVKKQLTDEQLRDYFTGLVKGRSEKNQKKLLECFLANFENERNALPGIAGSAWAAYNAVSEFADHELTVRGKGEQQRLEARLNSMWFGTGNAMKQDAFAAALALVV